MVATVANERLLICRIKLTDTFRATSSVIHPSSLDPELTYDALNLPPRSCHPDGAALNP
jgi:hypothetical protein